MKSISTFFNDEFTLKVIYVVVSLMIFVGSLFIQWYFTVGEVTEKSQPKTQIKKQTTIPVRS